LTAFLAGKRISATDFEAGWVGAESADHAENEHASKVAISVFFKITSKMLSQRI
jgi:hypothetical protein